MSKRFECSCHVIFNCFDRKSGFFGYFFVSHSVAFCHQENFTLTFGEFVNHFPEFGFQFSSAYYFFTCIFIHQLKFFHTVKFFFCT